MVTEGMQIVRGARDRYTGNQRNPWAEIECGYHYARAMSAHSLLLAAAGLDYDAANDSLSMAPRISPENFRAFFSTGQGWGTVSQTREGRTQLNTIEVAYGEVALRTLTVEAKHSVGRVTAAVNGSPVPVTHQASGGRLRLAFAQTLALRACDRLEVLTKQA
jgi:hypothetical protein